MTVMTFEKRDHIAVLTLNRPDSMNPLGHAGDGDAVAEICGQINADWSIRAVVLTGAGRAFSAGCDVAGAEIRDRTYPRSFRQHRAINQLNTVAIFGAMANCLAMATDCRHFRIAIRGNQCVHCRGIQFCDADCEHGAAMQFIVAGILKRQQFGAQVFRVGLEVGPQNARHPIIEIGEYGIHPVETGAGHDPDIKEICAHAAILQPAII